MEIPLREVLDYYRGNQLVLFNRIRRLARCPFLSFLRFVHGGILPRAPFVIIFALRLVLLDQISARRRRRGAVSPSRPPQRAPAALRGAVGSSEGSGEERPRPQCPLPPSIRAPFDFNHLCRCRRTSTEAPRAATTDDSASTMQYRALRMEPGRVRAAPSQQRVWRRAGRLGSLPASSAGVACV